MTSEAKAALKRMISAIEHSPPDKQATVVEMAIVYTDGLNMGLEIGGGK